MKSAETLCNPAFHLECCPDILVYVLKTPLCINLALMNAKHYVFTCIQTALEGKMNEVLAEVKNYRAENKSLVDACTELMKLTKENFGTLTRRVDDIHITICPPSAGQPASEEDGGYQIGEFKIPLKAISDVMKLEKALRDNRLHQLMVSITIFSVLCYNFHQILSLKEESIIGVMGAVGCLTALFYQNHLQ